jgi:hypothetical protein
MAAIFVLRDKGLYGICRSWACTWGSYVCCAERWTYPISWHLHFALRQSKFATKLDAVGELSLIVLRTWFHLLGTVKTMWGTLRSLKFRCECSLPHNSISWALYCAPVRPFMPPPYKSNCFFFEFQNSDSYKSVQMAGILCPASNFFCISQMMIVEFIWMPCKVRSRTPRLRP